MRCLISVCTVSPSPIKRTLDVYGLMTVNKCAAKVDNHISRDDIFNYHPLENVIFIVLYGTLFLYFLPFSSNHGAGTSKDSTMHIATYGCNNIFRKRVVFVNSFSAQADHDRRLNKSCHNH